MKRTERFQDLTAVNAELLRLDAIRDGHAENISDLFRSLKESRVRGTLLKNTAKGALGSFTPGKILGSLIGGGGIGSGLTMALGAGKGGLWKRMGMFALGLVAPKILKQLESISIPDIAHEFGVSWGRIKDHMQQRREEKELRKGKDENAEF